MRIKREQVQQVIDVRYQSARPELRMRNCSKELSSTVTVGMPFGAPAGDGLMLMYEVRLRVVKPGSVLRLGWACGGWGNAGLSIALGAAERDDDPESFESVDSDWGDLFNDNKLDQWMFSVGDDDCSWGVDGGSGTSSGAKFHGGQTEPYPLAWNEGDVIGTRDSHRLDWPANLTLL